MEIFLPLKRGGGLRKALAIGRRKLLATFSSFLQEEYREGEKISS